MARTRDDALAWVAEGTRLVRQGLAGLAEPAYDEPSGLPGWTRKHVVAHLAANADAIGNLVHWAATGERTPMYSSLEQRNADIEAGAQRGASDLRGWFEESATRLDEAMAALTEEQWSHEVLTAQGRTVPASETPWMRAREVLVHAVDLGTGTTFADLPAGFLASLGDDIAARRSAAGEGPALVVEAGSRWEVRGTGAPVTVRGPLADVVAWLAGRPTPLAAPDLPAWL